MDKICPKYKAAVLSVKGNPNDASIGCDKQDCQRWWKCREPENPPGTIDVYCRGCEYSGGIIKHECAKYKCRSMYVMGSQLKCEECLADTLRKQKDKKETSDA